MRFQPRNPLNFKLWLTFTVVDISGSMGNSLAAEGLIQRGWRGPGAGGLDGDRQRPSKQISGTGDTTTPAGKAMFQMMGVFAEFERAMIQERVRAGLRRAVDEGKTLGRPRLDADLEKAIRKALNEPGRPGVREIARRFGVAPGTVQRISRPFEASAF